MEGSRVTVPTSSDRSGWELLCAILAPVGFPGTARGRSRAVVSMRKGVQRMGKVVLRGPAAVIALARHVAHDTYWPQPRPRQRVHVLRAAGGGGDRTQRAKEAQS